MSDVQAIPPGFAAVLPYLVIKNAAAAFDFYQKAFGAETTMRMNMPSGAGMHAEMRIGAQKLHGLHLGLHHVTIFGVALAQDFN